MAEKKRLYSLLSNNPFLYLLSQTLIGPGLPRFLKKTAKALSERKGEKITIVDIGCGVGHHSKVVHEYADYIGFDYNEDYIRYAKEKYGRFGRFVCDDVSNLKKYTEFQDLLIVIGVLHHLDDSTARDLLKTLDGFSCDTVILDNALYGKSRIARKIVASDRGEHVRSYEKYLELFNSIKGFRHYKCNLNNISYCHVLSVRGDIEVP
jgi:SAM-dependent methyltransferase